MSSSIHSHGDAQTRPNDVSGVRDLNDLVGDVAAGDMPALVSAINRVAMEAARRSDPFLPGIVESIESVVMFVVGTPKSRYGHFMREAWRNEGRRTAEIVLNAAYLDHPAEDVMTTLLHEMAHAYANENNIWDTSRNGRYHNRRFGELAVRLGAHIIKDPKIGLRTQGLTAEGHQRYGDLLGELADVLTLVRDPVRAAAPATPTESSPATPNPTTASGLQRKYVFPVCQCLDRRGRREVAGRIAVGKWRPGKLVCTVCGSPLVDPDDPNAACRSLDNDPEAA